MMATRNRVAWGLAVLVAAVLFDVPGLIYEQWWQASRAERRHLAATIRGKVRSDLDLRRTNLAGADLSRATLIRVDLSAANLENSNLSGVDFQGTKLDGVKLQGARYDAHTRWPAGFDPTQQGALLVK